jgi:hypothetical protein
MPYNAASMALYRQPFRVKRLFPDDAQNTAKFLPATPFLFRSTLRLENAFSRNGIPETIPGKENFLDLF